MRHYLCTDIVIHILHNIRSYAIEQFKVISCFRVLDDFTETRSKSFPHLKLLALLKAFINRLEYALPQVRLHHHSTRKVVSPVEFYFGYLIIVVHKAL